MLAKLVLANSSWGHFFFLLHFFSFIANLQNNEISYIFYYSLSHMRLELPFANNGQNWLCSEFKCEYIEQTD